MIRPRGDFMDSYHSFKNQKQVMKHEMSCLVCDEMLNTEKIHLNSSDLQTK